MAKKFRGYGWENGNVVPFSRHGYSSSFPKRINDQTKIFTDSHSIVVYGGLNPTNIKTMAEWKWSEEKRKRREFARSRVEKLEKLEQELLNKEK